METREEIMNQGRRDESEDEQTRAAQAAMRAYETYCQGGFLRAKGGQAL